jgi:hypothetical protein
MRVFINKTKQKEQTHKLNQNIKVKTKPFLIGGLKLKDYTTRIDGAELDTCPSKLLQDVKV